MFKEKGLYFSPISDVHLSTPQEIKRALTATQRGDKAEYDETAIEVAKLLKYAKTVTVDVSEESDLTAPTMRSALFNKVKRLLPHTEVHSYFSSAQEEGSPHQIILSLTNLRQQRRRDAGK